MTTYANKTGVMYDRTGSFSCQQQLVVPRIPPFPAAVWAPGCHIQLNPGIRATTMTTAKLALILYFSVVIVILKQSSITFDWSLWLTNNWSYFRGGFKRGVHCTRPLLESMVRMLWPRALVNEYVVCIKVCKYNLLISLTPNSQQGGTAPVA